MRSRSPRTLTIAGYAILGVALASCGPAAGQAPGPDPDVHGPHPAIDDTPRVLVLTAMDSELAPLLELATVERVVEVNGRLHHLSTLGGQPVVLAATGISMVNATMAAQAAIDRFALTAVVYCGIAGTPSPEVGIGDVTVPARWAQYQEHVFTDASRSGWRRGWRNGNLGNFGMMHPQRVWALREGGVADEQELELWFPVADDWLSGAREAAGTVDLRRCNDEGHCVEGQPEVRVGGNGVSGPTFVDDPSYRRFVWETFEAEALDMETAAVAHVAYTHGIPYLAVRAVSDLAGGNPGENRVTSWLTLAADNAAVVTETLLRGRQRR